MEGPFGSGTASIGFQLELERSKSSSQMSQKTPSEYICDRTRGHSLKHTKATDVPQAGRVKVCVKQMFQSASTPSFQCLVSVAAASEARVGEGEISFSRLEALDPQKRELLEARFSTPRVRSFLPVTRWIFDY